MKQKSTLYRQTFVWYHVYKVSFRGAVWDEDFCKQKTHWSPNIIACTIMLKLTENMMDL